jgi:hypothetical protein
MTQERSRDDSEGFSLSKQYSKQKAAIYILCLVDMNMPNTVICAVYLKKGRPFDKTQRKMIKGIQINRMTVRCE